MNKKLFTLEQVQKKYKNKYIEVNRRLDYASGEVRFEVLRAYSVIHENTTLGQDLGTELAYRR